MTGARAALLPRRIRWRNTLATVVALVLVWMLLWGEFSWANLLGGLLVSVVLLLVLPLPPVIYTGRIRPVGSVWFVLRFLRDLVVASLQVSWWALRPGPPPRSAVIAVRLRVPSDLYLTFVATAVSLVPGSLIVEADRTAAVLYVHALGVGSSRDVERFRETVLAVEARLVRAIGSRDELRRLPASQQRGGGTR